MRDGYVKHLASSRGASVMTIIMDFTEFSASFVVTRTEVLISILWHDSECGFHSV